MGDRLVGSRRTEEMVVETWHPAPIKNLTWNPDAHRWLRETPMQGMYCIPAGGVGATASIYFEYQEDAVLFQMVWG